MEQVYMFLVVANMCGSDPFVLMQNFCEVIELEMQQ